MIFLRGIRPTLSVIDARANVVPSPGACAAARKEGSGVEGGGGVNLVGNNQYRVAPNIIARKLLRRYPHKP